MNSTDQPHKHLLAFFRSLPAEMNEYQAEELIKRMEFMFPSIRDRVLPPRHIHIEQEAQRLLKIIQLEKVSGNAIRSINSAASSLRDALNRTDNDSSGNCDSSNPES